MHTQCNLPKTYSQKLQHKDWFPYDRPDRPSRLQIGPSDRDDHMETQQRRLRRPGRSGRSRSLGSLQVLSGNLQAIKWKPLSHDVEDRSDQCTGYSNIQQSFCTAFQKMRSKLAQQIRESGDEAFTTFYGTVSGQISV